MFSHGGRCVLFDAYVEGVKELRSYLLKGNGQGACRADVEETLYKLQTVNMKLDPSGCTFGMEEGKFLGYLETIEGIKANLEKVNVILRSTTPKGPEQSIGTEETFNWTSEADKALQEIQKRLGKPHTLAVPKEGELLHPGRGGNMRRDGEEPS
ncbi:hypothetical protein Tco_0497698 [Tanacetum coccineum]